MVSLPKREMAPYSKPATGKQRNGTTATTEQWHSFESGRCIRVWVKSSCVSTVAFVLTAFSHVEMPQARARRSLAIKHFHMAAYFPLKCFPFNFLLGGIEKPLNVSYDPKIPHCNCSNESLLDLLGMLSSRGGLSLYNLCWKPCVCHVALLTS